MGIIQAEPRPGKEPFSAGATRGYCLLHPLANHPWTEDYGWYLRVCLPPMKLSKTNLPRSSTEQ